MPSSDDRDEPVQGQISAADRDALKRQSNDLDQRLRAARGSSYGKADCQGQSTGGGDAGMGRALRLSTELVAAVAVGAGIGLLFDKLIGSWPLMFILFFLLGAAAGMRNMVRAALNTKSGPLDSTKGPAVLDDEDDDR